MSVQDISIPQRQVYVQSTEPADKTEGKLWYNTANSTLYSSDGSNYYALEQDLTYIDKQQLEQDINILINGASASSTLNDYDDMFIDIFTDTSGYDNTVDTGNTTASFSTNKYANGGSATDAHGQSSWSTAETQTGKTGVKIHTNMACSLLSFTKEGSSDSTVGYLLDSSKATIASANFVGNVCTFSTAQSLSNNTDYFLATDKGGAGHAIRATSAEAFPYNKTKINFTSSLNHNGDVSTVYKVLDVISATFEDASVDKIVQTNAITITANPIGHQVYCHDTTSGTGSVNYNISFDGGSTWITGQSLNTKNTSVHAGSSMILKLNLNAGASAGLAEAKDYAIMLYY